MADLPQTIPLRKYTFVVIEQPIPIILKKSNSKNTVSVAEKLKTDLNSAGPLVLKSSYATQKYI